MQVEADAAVCIPQEAQVIQEPCFTEYNRHVPTEQMLGVS
jgi:hypothetical protein